MSEIDSAQAEAEQEIGSLKNPPVSNAVFNNTVDAISKYLVEDFMLVLMTAIFKIVLKQVDKPKEYTDSIQDGWSKRAESMLVSEAKKLHDTFLTAMADEDNRELYDEVNKKMLEFIHIQNTALNNAKQAIHNIINKALDEKDTSNENDPRETQANPS